MHRNHHAAQAADLAGVLADRLASMHAFNLRRWRAAAMQLRLSRPRADRTAPHALVAIVRHAINLFRGDGGKWCHMSGV